MFVISKSIFSEEEIQFLKENYSSMDNQSLATQLGKTAKQIKGKADYLKLKKGVIVNKFTHEEIRFIIENYNKIETSQIAKRLERTVKQINDKAYNMGLRRVLVRYSYDESYFEAINTDDKAYWLGFLYADGCISQIFNKKTGALKSRTMELTLAEKDREHLQKLLEALKSNKPIESKIIKNKDKNYSAYKVSINNKKICEDLMKLGCIPKKSLTLKFPNTKIVPDEFIKDFIRGYFDGDGCVHINHKNYSYSISFVGTMNMLKSIQEIVEHINLTNTVIKKKGEAYQVIWNGFANLNNWYGFLYKDASVFLERKHDKFIEAMNTKHYKRDISYYHRNINDK